MEWPSSSRRNSVLFVDLKYEDGALDATGHGQCHKNAMNPSSGAWIQHIQYRHTHRHTQLRICVCILCMRRARFNPPTAKLFDTRLGNGNWGKWEFGTGNGNGNKETETGATWQPAMRRCRRLWPHTAHQQHLPLSGHLIKQSATENIHHQKQAPKVTTSRFSGFLQLIFSLFLFYFIYFFLRHEIIALSYRESSYCFSHLFTVFIKLSSL